MERVPLEFGPDQGWAALRELCGHDEEGVAGASTPDAIALLDRLLVDAAGASVGPGRSAELTASDRDRLLHAIHQRNFTDRVEGTLTCESCQKPFDLDFKLSALVTIVREASNESTA